MMYKMMYDRKVYPLLKRQDSQASGGQSAHTTQSGCAVRAAASPAYAPRSEAWSIWKRRFALAALTVLSLTALALLLAVWTVRSVANGLPDINSLADVRLNKSTTIVSSDGETLAVLQTRDQRPISLSNIAPDMIEATIAVEDERFYQHDGVDGRGVLRALWSNLRLGRARGQGGSTLTQQLARNLYLTSEKTYRRKIAEMLLARRIEQKYSKHDILEAYLNSVYYGSGNYGIEAAAQSYLGKSARELTWGEAALLAGIPQRPTAYTPTVHLRAALDRRRDVLARLRANGKITPDQEARALAQKPHVLRPHPQSMASWKAPYFVSDVIAFVREKYGPEFVYSGVQITTTLNWQMQRAAEKTLRDALRQGGASGQSPNVGAIVSLDPRTGYVRALVGGPDFMRDQFDAVTRGVRQPGSCFKPFAYATAFETGHCDLLSIYKDAPLTYPAAPKEYVVHNYDERYRGKTDVLEALRHSLNTVAVKVGEEAGPANIAVLAARLGIRTTLEPTLPLALGASGVHPIELCSAYTAFANSGERFDPAFVTRITDARGQDVYQDDPAIRRQTRFLKQRTLDEINVGLREVVTSGTATEAASIDDAHGKTGTTSSHRDAWFVGYNADLATAIWVAHSRKETKVERSDSGATQTVTTTNYLPMEGATGGHLCVPLWTQFMQTALPIQRKSNAARGLASGPVIAPTLATLVDTLKMEAKTAAAKRTAEKPLARDEEGKPLPTGFVAAENGSGPITVTAPDDAQDKQTTPDNPAPDPSDTKDGQGEKKDETGGQKPPDTTGGTPP